MCPPSHRIPSQNGSETDRPASAHISQENARLAAIYARVASHAAPTERSLDSQERQLRAYAKMHNLEVAHVYRDVASGRSEERPGLQHMLADAQAGLFDVLLVRDPVRLFRDPLIFQECRDLLRYVHGIRVICLNHSPDGMADITFDPEAFEDFQLHQQRMQTALSKRARAASGLHNGPLPFGYVSGDGSIPQPHPVNAAGLVMAYETYATGRYSDREIAELLTREGYRTSGGWGERPFTKDTVNRMLQNVFYLGLVRHKGETFPGQHPPLISQELFDQCQAVRASRRPQRQASTEQKRVYMLAGIVRCQECKLTLRGCASQSASGHRYYRHTAHARGYDCPVPNKMVRADALEAQWGELVSTIQFPANWLQWASLTPEDRRNLTQLLVKAIYVDVLQARIIAIEPQPETRALFDDLSGQIEIR